MWKSSKFTWIEGMNFTSLICHCVIKRKILCNPEGIHQTFHSVIRIRIRPELFLRAQVISPISARFSAKVFAFSTVILEKQIAILSLQPKKIDQLDMIQIPECFHTCDETQPCLLSERSLVKFICKSSLRYFNHFF